MDADNELRKCTRCKKEKELNEFTKNKKNEYNKNCIKCLDIRIKSNEKNKCKHGRQKSTCIECGGVSMCEHTRRKDRCKICGDPFKLIINRWLYNSKQKDKKYNRYTGEDYLDADYCQELINFYKHCYHCRVLLQYVHYRDDLATIERLDNKLEHNKKNCVLACRTCNYKQLTNKNIN